MEDDGAGARASASWIKTNQGVATCIAGVSVLLLVYLSLSEWPFRELRDGFRLGFFTAVAVIAMLLCAISMIVDAHARETDEDVARMRWRDWGVAVLALAACYLYFHLAWNVDFLLISPVFLAAMTFWLGVRPLRSAVVAGVVITGVIYGLFALIGIELPTMILGL